MFLLGLDIVILTGGWTACSYWWVCRFRETQDEYAQQWLSVDSEKRRSFALALKSEFQGAEVRPSRVVSNHTHGEAAADRSTATLLIQRVAEGVGREPYYFQGSGADFRAGRAFSREYFWTKDLMAPYRAFEPGENDIISIVDVDYYVDMPQMMCDNFQPYMLYTFTPSKAARDSGDHGYCFLQDGSVRYHVSGGGTYAHPLWDWDGDSVRAYKTWMGVKTVMACYSVERRQIDDDHQVVLLVPMVRVDNPYWIWITENRLQAKSMARFNPVVGEFVRFYANTHEGLSVVTGKVGEYASNIVPASVDSIIASAAKTISGKLTLMTVKSKLKDSGREDLCLKAAEVLLEFHASRQPTTARLSLADSVRRYQWLPKGVEPDEDAKPGMTAFMRPLLHGAFVPDITEGNEQRFVDKRVKEVASKTLEVDPFTMKVMKEFVKHLVPDAVKGTLSPVEVAEVYKRQKRPSQQAILRQADHGTSEKLSKQFIKREAGQDVGDPRGISTINGYDKTVFSRYIYAFVDDVMKHQDWYAFGKSPHEVACRVATISCSAIKFGANTDFSRMDGRHSNVLHLLERMTYMRAFADEYHEELLETFDNHHHVTAKTTFGIVYQTEYQRLSGGADTSAGNTLDTAFIAYKTYRMMGSDPDAAWRRLGIYGGDDGYSADMDPATARRAAASVGQKLELQVVAKGDLGVSFLARRYGPGVWNGDTNSCCDIKRQLSKFHVCVNLPGKITPQTKLCEKAFAFALTDINTPVIGEFVRRVLELFDYKEEHFKNELGLWGVELDKDRQYFNAADGWMEDIVTAELPDFARDRFGSWLRDADRRTILDPPPFAEPLPPHPKPGDVAVGGDIIHVADDKGGDAEGPPSTEVCPDGKTHYRARKPKAERPSRQVSKKAPVETTDRKQVSTSNPAMKSSGPKRGEMKEKSGSPNA
jgi:hypothetical protein